MLPERLRLWRGRTAVEPGRIQSHGNQVHSISFQNVLISLHTRFVAVLSIARCVYYSYSYILTRCMMYKWYQQQKRWLLTEGRMLLSPSNLVKVIIIIIIIIIRFVKRQNVKRLPWRNMWQPVSIFLLLQIHVHSGLQIYASKSTYDPSNSFVEYRGLILYAMPYESHGTLENLFKIKILHISSSELEKKKK